MKYPFLVNHNPFSPHHFATLLQKCLKSKSLTPCKQIHALILTSGVDMNSLSLHSKLVGVYANCGCFTSAHSMFQITENLNVFAYNWMISALTFNGFFKEAINYFSLLQQSKNLVPNSYTFQFLLKCCVGLSDPNKGKEVHSATYKFGHHANSSVVNSLIEMYCKCDSLLYARQLFDKMSQPDIISWTNMISAYSNSGQLQESQSLFYKMILTGLEPNEFTWNALITGYARIGDCDGAFTTFSKMTKTGLIPDVVTWNTMISGFVQSQQTIKAMELFNQMLVAKVKPNPITITGILPAITSMGSVNSGREIHSQILKTNMHTNPFISSALIDMYSKCGCVKLARKVFDTTSSKNIASWNAMIGCYGKHGIIDSAIELFHKMEEEGVDPNQITLTCVLASCSHGGYVEKGLAIFKRVKESQKVKIRDEHYGCVVDMLCRSGKMEMAYDLMQELGVGITDSMVGALLNGCVVYDRGDLAKKMREEVVKRPGGFVGLCNVYAGEGEWEKVERLREVMKVYGVKKEHGFSYLFDNM
ncbi:unnamed protein product [Lactuca saligna]|uniref:Uncharacterized protein n=1 Tax=Lactuca saligna TaxID=75948 RepID=A0AA35YNR9_LACSI|nr:unnamed protein product [Lactuca saligna]